MTAAASAASIATITLPSQITAKATNITLTISTLSPPHATDTFFSLRSLCSFRRSCIRSSNL